MRIIAVAVLLFITIGCNQKKDSDYILTPEGFQTKVSQSTNGQLIDVRSPEEFNEGHLKGAVNININDEGFESRVNQLDKTKPVFVYCLSGPRSTNAASYLRKNGFAEVYELQGGMLAWRALSLPEEKPGSTASSSGMTQDDFSRMVNDSLLVLIDFNATWCGPCKQLAPILDELAETNKGKLKLIKIDIDENSALAAQMNITAIPVVQLYKNGNKVWEQLGLSSKETIENAINTNL